MANITAITPLFGWFLREQPLSSKFNSELKNKVNTLITNHVVINNGLESILAGASAGSSQAKIAFGLAAAPTGWTRDLDFATDHVLRVTDGSTLPPNPPQSNPTVVGGEQGGQEFNLIVGFSSNSTGSHTHTLSNHEHALADHTHALAAHTHGAGPHTHWMPTHNHTITATATPTGTASGNTTVDVTILFGPPNIPTTKPVIGPTHLHVPDGHDHTGVFLDAGAISSGGSSTDTHPGLPGSIPSSGSGASVTSALSTNTSDGAGTHSHSISNDGTWRPRYLNILLCKKD